MTSVLLKLRFASIMLLVSLISSVYYADAQTFDWAIRVGGNSNMIVSANTSNLINTDTKGNIYVLTAFNGTEDFDPGAGVAQLTPIMGCDEAQALVKYDSSGRYVWGKLFMSYNHTRNAINGGIAVDDMGRITVIREFGSSGNISSMGYFINSNGQLDSIKGTSIYKSNFNIVRYDSSGNFLWIKTIMLDSINVDSIMYVAGNDTQYNHKTIMPDLSIEDVNVDKLGNLYIVGYFSGAMDPDPGQALARLTTSSEYNPKAYLGSGGSRDVVVRGFVVKYDIDGNYLWGGSIGGRDSSVSSIIRGIKVDTRENKNDVYISGMYTGTTNLDIDAGIANWIEVDDERGQAFIAKYSSDGDYLWAKLMDSKSNNKYLSMSVDDIALDDKDGSIYVAITSPIAIDFNPGPDSAIVTPKGAYDIFLAKYNTDGNYMWAKSVGGSVTYASTCVMGISDLGDVYLSGRFMMGEIDFDPADSCTALLTSLSYSDIFLARYSPGGSYVWSGQVDGRLGGTAENSGLCITPKQGGGFDIYISGQLAFGAVDFDPDPNANFIMSPEKNYDAFLMKLSVIDTPASSYYLTVSLCDEKSYTLNETTYTRSGRYIQSLPGTIHCDSTIILDLVLNQIEQPVINIGEFVLGVTRSYATYQWLKNGVPIAGATDSTYRVTENADYQVIVTNEAGCTDTSEIYKVTNVSINNVPTAGASVWIYPNPVQDRVYIRSAIPVNITLTTIDGRTVMQQENAQTIAMQELPEGIYLLKITDREGRLLKTEKLVKIK